VVKTRADAELVVAAPAAPPLRAGRWRPGFRPDPFRLLGIVLLVLAWSALTAVVPASSLPPPQNVARRLAADFFAAPELGYYGLGDASLLGSMLYTATNVVVAVALGGSLGSLAGLVTARFGLARAVLDPVVLTAGTVPILVAAPFFLIWFGTGRASSVILVTLYVAVILYVFAQRAADNLDPVYEDSARTLGAQPRDIVRDILLPGTVPAVLGGIRIALAGAWGLEAIAELLGAQEGIGKIVEVLAGATDVEGIFAALLLLGLVAVACDALAAYGFSRLAGWSLPARAGGG
jgi:ABC-type nitrate/sulfonate/bicarbonate transport system permease component